MKIYYSTFISGFQELIDEQLEKTLPDLKIEVLLDGLVVYQTSAPIDRIKQIKYFNNSFLLLHLFKGVQGNAIDTMLDYVVHNPQIYRSLPSSLKNTNKTFRIMASLENQLITTNKKLLHDLEDNIHKQTQLQPDRSNPDGEFWFLQRREGYGFFGIRLTKHRDYAKILQKGELRPELANILCILSEPKTTEVFLDPFCGYGTIPLTRIKITGSQKIIAVDNDSKVIPLFKQHAKKYRKQIEILRTDSLHMNQVAHNSVDKIVTDPPWGFYTKDQPNMELFYTHMLEDLWRVLKPNGLLIILIGQKALFEDILQNFRSKLQLIKKYDILVSGKKAGVYKIFKDNNNLKFR